jgi:hypothetical protein
MAWHGEKARHSVAAHKAWKTKRAKAKKVKSAK